MLTFESHGAFPETALLDGVAMPIDHDGEIPSLDAVILAALRDELERTRYNHVSSYRAVANRALANSPAYRQTVRVFARTIFQGYLGRNDRLSALVDQGLFATPNFEIDIETGAVVQVPGIRLYTVQDETAEA